MLNIGTNGKEKNLTAVLDPAIPVTYSNSSGY